MLLAAERRESRGSNVLDALDTRLQDRPAGDAEPEACDDDTAIGGRLRCAECGHVLTLSAYAVSVRGRDRHVATNPGGFTYRFRTFFAAPGCAAAQPAYTRHSWFPPLAWRISDCAACGLHCGWCFERDGAREFYALIENRLVEEGGG